MTHPSTQKTLKTPSEWWSNTPADLIAGMVVALALIPEAIAFSIIAGLDPKVGLYTSFTMTVTIAFLGGRVGMVSAATGAMALLLKDLVGSAGDDKALALELVLAVTLLTGFLQIVWGTLRISRVMEYVPRAVLVGFVNALAILIFLAQLEQFEKAKVFGAEGLMSVMVAAGLAIIYLLPRLTKNIPVVKSIPPQLVAIVALTAVSVLWGLPLPTVGDMGALPTELPYFRLPNLPLSFATLQMLLPVALALSGVGLLESFLTASVLDDMTDTNSDKKQVARGQGAANLVTGLLGGMAGSAMIGQSALNIKAGGRQRLSTFSAGIFLISFILFMGEGVVKIPMAALVAVMFMVSISTFNWGSLMSLGRTPKRETAAMLVTVLTAVITKNLAIGVVVGIAVSAMAKPS